MTERESLVLRRIAVVLLVLLLLINLVAVVAVSAEGEEIEEEYLLVLFPHFRCDLTFFFTEGVGVDGGGLHGSVAHPLLGFVEGDAFYAGVDAKGVAKGLGHRRCFQGDPRPLHGTSDNSPGCGAAEAPQSKILSTILLL